MTTQSVQQVLNELKNKKENMILTSSAFGVAEAYLYAYKKQCNLDHKIVTITEIYEVNTQKKGLDELDLSFYIESSLALNLSEQLLKRNLKDETLRIIRTKMQRNCERFQVGMERDYKTKYQQGMYLNPILDYIKSNFEWEWLIANFDRPIVEASKIQSCIHQYVNGLRGPSRMIVSAYDPKVIGEESYGSFQIMNLSSKKEYQQLLQEAMLMLYHLYPILWRHHQMIYRVLNHPIFQQSYINGEYTYDNFMRGLRKFYDAHHCIDASGCFISDEEYLCIIQDYIKNSISENIEEQKKKSKLYI